MLFFLSKTEVRKLKNSGPIGLSFVVVLSKKCSQNLEYKAIAQALILNLVHKMYGQYFNETHTPLKSKEHSCEFQKILNKQDKQIQYTIEDKKE